MNRRGLALVELVVALALAALLAGLAATTIARAGGLLRDRAERAAAEQTLRTGAVALEGLLAPAHAGAGELQGIGPGGLIARAIRGSSVLCDAPGGALVVRRGAGWWSAVRDPVAGRDSLEVGRLDVPGWISLALDAGPVPARCPDGSPALSFPLALDPAATAPLGAGSPLRFYEPVELRSYASAGAEWLGARLVATGETIQPLAGPLLPGRFRLQFTRLDGQPALAPADAATAGFIVGVRLGGGPDSVNGLLTLRWVPR